jgi:hypothetical protein
MRTRPSSLDTSSPHRKSQSINTSVLPSRESSCRTSDLPSFHKSYSQSSTNPLHTSYSQSGHTYPPHSQSREPSLVLAAVVYCRTCQNLFDIPDRSKRFGPGYYSSDRNVPRKSSSGRSSRLRLRRDNSIHLGRSHIYRFRGWRRGR